MLCISFKIGNTFNPEKSRVEVRKKPIFRFHFTYPPSYERSDKNYLTPGSDNFYPTSDEVG